MAPKTESVREEFCSLLSCMGDIQGRSVDFPSGHKELVQNIRTFTRKKIACSPWFTFPVGPQ